MAYDWLILSQVRLGWPIFSLVTPLSWAPAEGADLLNPLVRTSSLTRHSRAVAPGAEDVFITDNDAITLGLLCSIITGSIAGSARRRYLIYSEADFEVLRPAGATRCYNEGAIWRGGDRRSPPHAKFHPHRFNG